MKTDVEPCSGMCCPKKEDCLHYHVFRSLKLRNKILLKYVGEGNPSRCYARNFRQFISY